MKNFLFFWFIFSIFFFTLTLADSITSSGGNITPVNLSILQTTDRWQVFYGKTNLSNINNLSTSYNLPSLNIDLPSTSSYYLISDSSSLDGDYSVPSLDEVDSYFNLSGYSSSNYIFNNESNFSLYVGSTLTTFSLPTLYLAGKNEDNSTNPYAFRSGIIKKGSAFVFVIPISNSKGLDGQSYNFMFALPTKLEGITYYIFTNMISETSTAQQPSSSLSTLSLSWVYDGKILTISSLPEVNILLYDELGGLYSGTTNNNGILSFSLPAGFKYYLTAKKVGYKQLDLIFYIPKPTIIENISKEEPESQKILQPQEQIGEEELKISGPQTIFIQGSGGDGGISICFQVGDCYSTKFASREEIERLTEVNCISSFCTLTGFSKSDFISKYQLKKTEPIFFSPKTNQSIVPFDYGLFFQNIGYELSKSLGSTKVFDVRFPNFFFYVFVFFSVLAIILYVLFSRLAHKEAFKGHD
ncbi:MAG: hypothetical protein ACK4J0_00690 [Candidatus Anstonellaceae archaeon]